MAAQEQTGSLAEAAVKDTLALGSRIAAVLHTNGDLGAWLASDAVAVSLSPELLAFALPEGSPLSGNEGGNKLAFLILSSKHGSSVEQLIADAAAKAFRRTGAALTPYLDVDDLTSLLRWRLWRLDATHFSPARILKHPGLAAYVSVIARRILIDEARALSNRSRTPIEAIDIESGVDPRSTIDSVLDDLDLLHRFGAELPDWQAPLVAVLAGEVDRDDALSAINRAREAKGLPPWTAESLRTGIHRARLRLRELLDEPPSRSTVATSTRIDSGHDTRSRTQPWRRFWCRPDQSYSLDDGGFLVDPETEYGEYLQPNAVALDRLDDCACLILLGEPGIGKSTALQNERRRLSEAGYEVVFVDLSRTPTAPALQVAVAPARKESTALTFVMLDGLDEGLTRNPELSSELIGVLKTIDASRTRLRVSSRTLEWPRDLELGLRLHWGSETTRVYELLPLRREDVLSAARERGVDALAFVELVREREVVSLAIRPISLRFLLEMYALDGALPHSRTRLFDEGSLILCSEEAAWQRGRGRGNPDVYRRRAIAARLAALSVFTNTQTIDRSTQTSVDVLSVSAAIGGAETTDEATYVVDARAVEDVLTGTALFTARAGTAFGWSHQSYREFLAAWYLAQHNVGVDAMGRLYFPEERSRVPTALREVAAWHATFAPEMFDLLLERDPEVLLHTDIGEPAQESREKLTDALLRRLARFNATDSSLWRNQYRRLRHPGLAVQLRPFIRDKTANIIVRRASMDIAWACEVHEVVDDLIAVLHDATDDLRAREVAARSLGQFGGEKVDELFGTILTAGFEPDPNDSIRGSILERLWPDHIDSQALFQAMPAPRRNDYTGTYQRFIDRLPPKLKSNDLYFALLWVEKLGPRPGYHLERTQQLIVDLALENLDRHDVVESLGRIIRDTLTSRFGRWDSTRGTHRRKKPRQDLSTKDRHSIVDELIRTAHEDSDRLANALIFSTPPLLLPEDIVWLATKAATSGDDIAGTCGTLVATLYRQFGYPTDPATLEAVLAVESATFRSHLSSFLDAVDLGSDAARTLKERWRLAQQPIDQPSDVDADVNDRAAKWDDVAPQILRTETGDLEGWPTFMSRWSQISQSLPKPVTELAGWTALPPETKERVVLAGLRYLNDSPPLDPNLFYESGTYYWGPVAARAALQLIAEARPEFLDHVSQKAWRQWCPVLVGVSFPEIETEIRIELFRRCNAFASPELDAAIVRVVRRDSPNDTAGFLFRDLPRPATPSLQLALLALLDELRDHAFEEALELLVESGNAAALDQGSTSLQNATPARAARAARIILARNGAQWPTVISRVRSERAFAEAFAELVSHDDSKLSALTTLNERMTAELFLSLFRTFPSDPNQRQRGGLLSTADHATRFRDRMIRRLVDFGTADAISALEWVIEEEPNHPELQWWLVPAREKYADRAWKPLSISQFWASIAVSVEPHGDGTGGCIVHMREDQDVHEAARVLRAAIPGLKVVVSKTAMSLTGPAHAIAKVRATVEKVETLRKAILTVRAGEEWVFEAVPITSVTKRPTRPAGVDEIARILCDVHVVIETATDHETAALLSVIEPLPTASALIVGAVGFGTYTIGKLGRYAVAHLQTDMGPEGANGSPLATGDAIREVKPKVILLIGIAFGINRSKQRLGDVLTAQHITSYEMVKIGTEPAVENAEPQKVLIDERGETLHGNPLLLERIKAHRRDWTYARADGSLVDIFIGQVLSGAKLVNNREFRDSLNRRFPAALGGEMEGIGAYSAAFRRNVPVLLVKAICDWADGLKNDLAQPFAAAVAVDLVAHILNKPDSLRALGVPELAEVETQTAADTQSADANTGALIAFGPDVVVSGNVIASEPGSWTIEINGFTIGSEVALREFLENPPAQPSRRYILLEETSDGRVITGGSSWRRQGGALIVSTPVAPRHPRSSAQDIGGDLRLDATNDLIVPLEIASGLDLVAQRLVTSFSNEIGGLPTNRNPESRFTQYYFAGNDPALLSRLWKLEAIRLANVPMSDGAVDLDFIRSVKDIRLINYNASTERADLAIELELEGGGRWSSQIVVPLRSKPLVRGRFLESIRAPKHGGAVTAEASGSSIRDRTFLYNQADQEARTLRSYAVGLVGPVSASERLVVLSPHGAPYDGLGLSAEKMLDALNDLDTDTSLTFPEFQGKQQILTNGVVRSSGENADSRFAIARDGSIAVRRRLFHDRKGYGSKVSRGDIGLYTSLEQLLHAIEYARKLIQVLGSSRVQWSFREEMHGIRGRHLMDDVEGGRPDGGAWKISSPSDVETIAVAGEIDLNVDLGHVGTILDQAAIKIAAWFGLHQPVRELRPGSVLIAAPMR